MGCLLRLLLLPLSLLGIKFGAAKEALPILLMLKYQFNNQPKHEDDPILIMSGRTPGFIGRILNSMGLLTISQLTITQRELKVEVSSLEGNTYFVAPLAQLTTSDLTLQKSIFYLYLAGIIMLGFAVAVLVKMATLPIVLGCLAVSLFLVFLYWNSKRFIVAFSTSEMNEVYGLGFESTMMAGVSVQYNNLLKDIQYINWIIVNAHYTESRKK